MDWFGLVLWHINHCRLFNVKSSLYIYIKYMICKHIVDNILNEPKLILLHTVKCFQLLLCISENSTKHQSFVYTRLNDWIVLFLTIQFNISHLFAHSLNVKQFYQVLPLQVRVDLGVMAMKVFSTFPKASKLDPHRQIV